MKTAPREKHKDDLPNILALQDRILLELDKEIKEKILVEFREGSSLRELARKYLAGHELGIATNVVRLFLQSTIPEEELTKLMKGRGAMTQIREKRGIHGQDSFEKAKRGKEGAEKSGGIIFSDEEEARLQELMVHRDFQYGMRINAEKIAKALNDEFHTGRPIRESTSLRQKISRLKKKIQLKIEKALT